MRIQLSGYRIKACWCFWLSAICFYLVLILREFLSSMWINCNNRVSTVLISIVVLWYFFISIHRLLNFNDFVLDYLRSPMADNFISFFDILSRTKWFHKFKILLSLRNIFLVRLWNFLYRFLTHPCVALYSLIQDLLIVVWVNVLD